MSRKKFGFTLVELMVVAVIVAILAAVAIPLISANKKRAMATEAESTLGTIRSAMRALYAQKNAYNVDLNGTTISALSGVPGVTVADLKGRYFLDTDYSITVGASTYSAQAKGSVGDANGITITLDQDGNFNYSGL